MPEPISEPRPDAPVTQSPEKDPRVYFAAERTFLAWIRTGIALMGFGFALARFGLFLRQMQASQTASVPVHSTWGSPITGVSLITLGILVNIAASVNYVRITRQLAAGEWMPGKLSRTAIALALILALLGTGMGAYLLYLR